MFIYNSSNSDKSTFATIIKVLMITLTVWQLFMQAYALLSFTRTKIGSRIRKGFMHTILDYADDSIEVVSERAVPLMKKYSAYEKKFEQAAAEVEAAEKSAEEE